MTSEVLPNQNMDDQSDLNCRAGQGCLGSNAVDTQTTEVIESVAKKLSTIGDDLNQSHKIFNDNKTSVEQVMSGTEAKISLSCTSQGLKFKSTKINSVGVQ